MKRAFLIFVGLVLTVAACHVAYVKANSYEGVRQLDPYGSRGLFTWRMWVSLIEGALGAITMAVVGVRWILRGIVGTRAEGAAQVDGAAGGEGQASVRLRPWTCRAGYGPFGIVLQVAVVGVLIALVVVVVRLLG